MRTSTHITSFCLGLAFVGSGLFFTGCKKDTKDPEPDPPSNLTNTERLTGKNYKMTSATVEPAILGGYDWYAQLEECQKDNLYRFDTPNAFKEDEGATRCNPSDPQTLTGTWTWNTDETVLTVKLEGEDPFSLTVLTNNGTTLRVKYTETIQGINYAVTATYTKQ